MWVLSVCRWAFLGFSVALLLVVGLCYCDNKIVEVVGVAECVDCMQNNLKSNDIFSGLQVSIECKVADGDQMKTRAVGKLDEEGQFKVRLPKEMVKDDNGQLMEKCFAKLIHTPSSSVAPCAIDTENGQEVSSKIILINSKEEDNNNNGKYYTFGTAGKLAYSPLTCSLSSSTTSSGGILNSKLLHLLKHHHPWHKPLPKFHISPIHKKPGFPLIKKKHLLHPVYKKPPLLIPPIRKKPFLPAIPKIPAENHKLSTIPKIPHILKKKKLIHHHLPKHHHIPPKHLPHT